MESRGGSDDDLPHVLILFDDAERARVLEARLAHRTDITVSTTERPVTGLEFLDLLAADTVVVVTRGTGAHGQLEHERAARLAEVVPSVVVRPPFDPAAGPDPFGMFPHAHFTDTIDDSLVELVITLAKRTSATRRAAPTRAAVLAIGAHPDDVEIGVGGTLAAHVHAGDEVAILTMSRGARGGASDAREREAHASAEVIGARLFLDDLPDTEFSDGGDTVRRIEAVVREVSPTIVYVHSAHDRHQDHRAVHHATRVAARRVPTLAAYQSPSSTVEFRPTEFVAIDEFLTVKLEMLAAYTSQEARDYLAPETVRTTAAYWSRYTGGGLVEPLEMLRTNLTVAGAAPTQSLVRLWSRSDLP